MSALSFVLVIRSEMGLGCAVLTVGLRLGFDEAGAYRYPPLGHIHRPLGHIHRWGKSTQGNARHIIAEPVQGYSVWRCPSVNSPLADAAPVPSSEFYPLLTSKVCVAQGRSVRVRALR